MPTPRNDASSSDRARQEGSAALETWSSSLDLRALAEVHGTPLYVIDSGTLRENFAKYQRVAGRADHIRYPVKANPSAGILEVVAELGGGADCASRDEVTAALDAGIALGAVTYNSPAPDLDLTVWLLHAGATVVADSVQMLEDLRERVDASEPAGRLFVRVNPGELPGYAEDDEIHRYTAHAGEASPFGIPSEELPQALEGYPLPVTGLHMHVGTQMDNLEAFEAEIGFLHELSDVLEKRTGHRVSTLNLGGGLGIPFRQGQTFPSVDALADALDPLKREGVEYQVEPGNSLVGNAVALLARVVALKEVRGRRWGILDVGTDQLVKHTIARWEHEIVDAAHRPLPTEGPDALAGPLCFAGDVLLPSTRLDGVQRGDPVLVRHAGAYCEAVSSRFNGRRGPAHLVIDADGSARLARRAEDPFFQPRVQMHVPGAARRAAAEDEPIDRGVVDALQSGYMHEQAAEEGYTILDAARVGERAYRFSIEPRAALDIVAMPLALRIAGDASIIAVGDVLGWRTKAGPVWATHLSLTFGSTLPADAPFPCRVVVDAPRRRRAGGNIALVRFELGTDAVGGVARVVVPAGGAASDPAP